MSAANPFALAAEALQDTADRLSTRVLYGEPALAPHLADVRAALAVFERLASVEVEVSYQDPPARVRFTARYLSSIGINEVRSREIHESIRGDRWWVQGMDPGYHETQALVDILAAIECRLRNEAQP